MLPVTKDLIEVNPFSRAGRKLRDKLGIVMHYTADPGASAMNISDYFGSLKRQNLKDNEPDRYAGAHYQVDRFKIVNSIPDDEEGFHCGSKVGYRAEAIAHLGLQPNKTTVGIEMCIEKDGSIHEDTFQNAADLVAYLIKERGFPESIWTHKGVVGWKDCPLPWVKNPSEFVRFKKAVVDRLRPPQVKVEPPLPVAPKPVEEDEDNMPMKLENWAWIELKRSLSESVKQGFLNESWLKRIDDKSLTAAELAVLNNLILERSIKKLKEDLPL